MKQIILLLLIFMAGCRSPNSTRSTAIQQFFDMDSRLQNVEARYLLDGGSMILHLTDVYGNKSTICIDNQGFAVKVSESKRNSTETTELINSLKIKCIDITDPLTKASDTVEYQSDLEASVLKRIRRMARKNPQFNEELSYFIETTRKERFVAVIYE